MKKVIQFIIGAVAMEYSLVAACYMDSEGAAGNMAASNCGNHVLLVGSRPKES